MTNLRPLAYLGVDSPNPPKLTISPRAPVATDYNGFKLGDEWIDTTAVISYKLLSKAGGASVWSVTSPGASDVDTINGLAPALGNIIIDGGTNITDANAGNTVTLNLNPAITLATSVTSPIYASAAAMAINPTGALVVTGGGAIDINAGAAADITLQLGDAAGLNNFEIEDSAGAAVATIDSNGVGTFVGIDGPLGGVTPAAVTGTTITANTSLVSATYTAPAATDLAINAIAGEDIIIKMGDNAAANKVSFVDSDSIEVFAIDSNGGIGTLVGATVTGNFAQTAGTFNVGQDNAANAINIGGGNVSRAITLGATGAHTLNIGNAAAGAIAIDSAAGISIDAATASNVTVSGAGADLTVQSSAGSVVISGGEAIANAVDIDASAGGLDIDAALQINIDSAQVAADAVRINASNAAGGIDIDAGTGGIAITTTGALDIDSDGAASWLNDTGDLHLEAIVGSLSLHSGEAVIDAIQLNAVAGGIDINADGENCDITAASHSVHITSGEAIGDSILLNATAGGIDITSAQDIDITATGTSINIESQEAAADAIYIHASNAAGGLTIATGTGGIIADTDANVEINSSAGTILIGDDDIDQNIELGTDGERTVTVGSVNGAAALVLQSGTGEISVTGTVKEINAEFLTRSGDSVTFQSDPLCMIANGTYAVPAGATGEVDYLKFQEGIQMEQFIIGAGQAILAPTMNANGLLASLDLAVGEGVEYNFDAARNNSRHAFTIGTSPAFFFELRMRINDMDGADPYMFGFRRVEANNATWENYTDFAAIGMNAVTSVTEIITATELNAGGTTLSNTTDLWGGDASTNTMQVLVSAAGVVTYTINGAAPTVPAAFTFDNGDVVVPFIRIEHSAAPTAVNLISMKIGYQA